MRRRSPLRAVLALLTALVLAAFPAIASADVSFTPAAQEAFGVDADGNPIPGSDRSGTFPRAWDTFRATEEGERIFDQLDEDDVDLTVDFKPEAEVGDDGDSYGTAQGFDWDDESGIRKPSEITIEIADRPTRSASAISNTIHHEFRHSENFRNGNFSHVHDRIDDRRDGAGGVFRTQRDQVLQPTPTATPPLFDETPNWDRLQRAVRQERWDRGMAQNFADIIGDYVDSDSSNQDKFVVQDDELTIDLKSFGGYTDSWSIDEVDLNFNDSLLECGAVTDGRRGVCAEDVLPMPAGEVLSLGITVAAEIPQANPDRYYVYAMVLDSDDDPANDWVGFLDWDYFLGTDRWYQLIWSPTESRWSVVVMQVAAGDRTSVVTSSTVRAVIEGDTVAWFVSASEFPSALPGYRLTAFAHDGGYGVETRIGDVSGGDPTEPLAKPVRLP